MGFASIFKRVRETTDIKNQSALAEFLGITTSSVSGAKNRDNFPPTWVFKIAEEYKVNPVYLLQGEGEIAQETSETYTSSKGANFIFVPKYNVKASAGHGTQIHSEQVVDHLAFKKKWIADRINASEENLVLIEVDGDSMAPTLLDGDLILVNQGVQKFKGDALYVLKFDDELQVKRVQRLPNGDVLIKSDNPVYEPFRAIGDQIELLTIIGRVVWFGREM